MPLYKVVADGTLWIETTSMAEADEAFEDAQQFLPGARITYSEWYEPPKPIGHWIDTALVLDGETLHDHRLTRRAE